jgi:hypothetical protein
VDSASNTKVAGRKKVQRHTPKNIIHAQIAEAVFSVNTNPQYSENYAVMQRKFTHAIEHRLGM